MQAFDRHIGSRMRFESIQVKFQTDGWNCGVWTLVVDEAFAAYCDSAYYGKGTFGSFLTTWAARRGRGVVDLNAVRGSGSRRDAVTGNEKFIREERKRVRERLLFAAMEKRLPLNDGPRVDIFVEEGTVSTDPMGVDESDDDE